MKGGANRRHVARTVLLVGEGDSEVVLLRHLKALYVLRGSGVAVRQSLNAAFDLKVALLDTDTDWNDKTRAVARKAKVQVVAADPCLEALLLTAYGYPVQGKTTARLKQEFSDRFGGAAFESKVYEKYFSKEFMEKARIASSELDQLLNVLVK